MLRLTRRQIASSARLAAEKTVPAIKPVQAPISVKPAPKKKSFSLTGLLFKTALVGAVGYGATLYVATKNDQVMDFVIDKQLPYYEELLDLIENGLVQGLQDRYVVLRDRVRASLSKENINELTQKLEHQGETLIEETRRKLSHDSSSYNNTDATPAQQLQKPVEIEAIRARVEQLPLLLVKSADVAVADTVQALNRLLAQVDKLTVQKGDALVKTVNDAVTVLLERLEALTQRFNDTVLAKLKDLQTELLALYTKKELELTENLLHQFTHEKAQLDQRLQQRLAQEIAAAKESISQAAVNAVLLVRIEQTKQFEKLVQERVNSERDGRLANVEAVVARLDQLDEFAVALEQQLVAEHQKTVLKRAVGRLRSVLLAAEDPTSPPKAIGPYIEELVSLSKDSNSDILRLALVNLQPLARESNQLILTTAQLASRWEQLVPELRSASLLPPNAGLLGHLASLLFLKLLLPVKGNKPDGKDIESVIGRVEQSLVRGDLDLAVEEVTNLKGWGRKLADDWVVQGRKRLEAEFLLGLIETEASVM